MQNIILPILIGSIIAIDIYEFKYIDESMLFPRNSNLTVQENLKKMKLTN